MGRDDPTVGHSGWDGQPFPVASRIPAWRMLGRRWQLAPSTTGLSSPWIPAGMLQQRMGRIWGEGCRGICPTLPTHPCPSLPSLPSPVERDLPADLPRGTSAPAAGEDALPRIPHLAPPFSVFQQPRLAAGREGREKAKRQLRANGFLEEKPRVASIHPSLQVPGEP